LRGLLAATAETTTLLLIALTARASLRIATAVGAGQAEVARISLQTAWFVQLSAFAFARRAGQPTEARTAAAAALTLVAA
jgi:hypothetical protein